MPHLVLAFDPSTSIVCFSCQEGVEELPFPVAALLCSLRSYAEQEGWQMEDVSMQNCHRVYHKGSTGLLWAMLHSSQLLGPNELRNLLQVIDVSCRHFPARTGTRLRRSVPQHDCVQRTSKHVVPSQLAASASSRKLSAAVAVQVADAVTAMLLGPAVCSSGHAAMKRCFRGISSYLEPLFQPSLQLTWPLTAQLLPHQTILQPSAAAAQLPRLLRSLQSQATLAHAAVAAAADGGSSSTAAMLLNGCYCCATSSWQSMGSLQLLALQLVAARAAAECAAQQPSVEKYGQMAVHLPVPQKDAQQANNSHAETRCVQLLWCNLQPGLQLCLLSNNLPLQLFMHNTQQQLVSFRIDAAEVVPLLLPEPALAVVVVNAAGHWATYNGFSTAAKRHDASNCFVQLAIKLQQQAESSSTSVLLHTQHQTIAGVAVGRGCKAYLLADGNNLSMSCVQELVQICVPEVVLRSAVAC